MLEENDKALAEIVRKYRNSPEESGNNGTLERIISGVIFTSCLRPNVVDKNPLSVIEMLCLILVVSGKKIKDCAKVLGMAESSIRTYEQRARSKLNAKNRATAFYQALLKGYISIVN